MPSDTKFVYNKYIGWQKAYCFDRRIGNEEITSLIRELEEYSNLNLMADQNDTPEILDGEVATISFDDGDCEWAGHENEGPHTCIIVSIYSENKDSDEETIYSLDQTIIVGTKHKYKKNIVTNEVEKCLNDFFKTIVTNEVEKCLNDFFKTKN